MANIKLEGMEELIDKVNKLGDRGKLIKEKALDKAGKIVKGTMEKKAPRSQTAKRHMADNIKVSEIKREDGIDYINIGPNKGDNSEFYYSKFTEWGTSKIPAQHWAEKSIIANNKEINNIISEELQKGLDDLDK